MTECISSRLSKHNSKQLPYLRSALNIHISTNLRLAENNWLDNQLQVPGTFSDTAKGDGAKDC